MPFAWSCTVMPYCPMPTSVENRFATSSAGSLRRSTRCGRGSPAPSPTSTPPACRAISITLSVPSFSVSSK
ncbi:hypothetical protein V2I01_36415 [Micromonospora sp. BRA006-A]|nr:hypothetical protein [Micromonospora sp. BRA006-A]